MSLLLPSFRHAATRLSFARPFSSAANKTAHLIVNALGMDRMGIVSDMTNLVTMQGGSVGESNAIKIGGHFSLTMLVSLPTDKAEALKESLKSIEGMNTNFIETDDPKAVKVSPVVGYSGRFTLAGADHPGLVHKVTTLLNSHGLSIDTMETSEADPVAYGGTTLFVIDGLATATEERAKKIDTDKIREELAELGEYLNCDISLIDDVSRKDRYLSKGVWENLA
jgi:glycine cleavage system transcriptional repressor